MAKRKVPIYLVCGFLESGKTSFINETVFDENFSDGTAQFGILFNSPKNARIAIVLEM